jgi:pyruvate formate lyase activating enzyme
VTFKGWQKTSLIEYPGKVATVLFAGGCSFRCPFCHNPGLVLAPEDIPDLSAETVLSYLDENRRLYQAVVVSGGEPTLSPGLPDFFRRVGRLGLLRGLAAQKLVEHVAMDVKAPLDWEAYRAAAGLEPEDGQVLERVRESIAVLSRAGVQVEFRCTAVPGLHTAPDLLELAAQLRGAQRLALQAFRPGPTLAPGLSSAARYPEKTLQEVAGQVRGWFSSVEVRQ